MRDLANTSRPPRKTAQPPAKTGKPAEAYDHARANPVWRKLSIQTKPLLNAPGDAYEQEADQVADQVMRMAGPAPAVSDSPVAIQRRCAACEDEEQKAIQTKPAGSTYQKNAEQGVGLAVHAAGQGGESLPEATRAFFEPRFGSDFSHVRVHANGAAAEGARAVQARAYTIGRDIVFGAGQYAPATPEGQRLLAHELAHTLQQAGPIRRQTAQAAAAPRPDQPDPLTAPLTDSEWRQVDIWLSRGEVIIEPLTADADHNADIIAGEIFCQRALFTPGFGQGEDPLLCLLRDVTTADKRVQKIKQDVVAHGPIINWAAVSTDNRLLYVMEQLIGNFNYPVNGAAGIVGNLYAESGVLPSRIEGSQADTPMKATDFKKKNRFFSPDEVRDRDKAKKIGPKMPGIGLAQWTTDTRRTGLFQRQAAQGPSILFNMDAQIAYLVSELQANAGLQARLSGAGVSVNDASDDVVYRFEIPGAILNGSGGLLPRTDPAVQAVFTERRGLAQKALQAYRAAHPE